MRKEYKKPSMEMIGFETAYGILDDILSKDTNGTEGNPSNIRAKPNNGWQMENWEETETEND